MRYAIIVDSGDQQAVIAPFRSEQSAKDFRDTQIDHNLATNVVELHDPKDFVADMHWEEAKKAAQLAFVRKFVRERVS